MRTAACLAVLGLWCASTLAEPPCPPQTPGSPRTIPATPAPAAPESSTTSDDDFIEFLGGDDVGDPDLWDYLKKSVSAVRPSQAPPTQEGKP